MSARDMVTAVATCTLCGAGYGKCDCWRRCDACGWTYERGSACRNPACSAAPKVFGVELWWTSVSSVEYRCGRVTILGGQQGYRHPFLVRLDGTPMQRRHGNYTGYQRFSTAKAAMRWLTLRVLDRPSLIEAWDLHTADRRPTGKSVPTPTEAAQAPARRRSLEGVLTGRRRRP